MIYKINLSLHLYVLFSIGYKDIVDLLTSRGAKRGEDKDGIKDDMTLLHFAAYEGNVSLIF